MFFGHSGTTQTKQILILCNPTFFDEKFNPAISFNCEFVEQYHHKGSSYFIPIHNTMKMILVSQAKQSYNLNNAPFF